MFSFAFELISLHHIGSIAKTHLFLLSLQSWGLQHSFSPCNQKLRFSGDFSASWSLGLKCQTQWDSCNVMRIGNWEILNHCSLTIRGCWWQSTVKSIALVSGHDMQSVAEWGCKSYISFCFQNPKFLWPQVLWWLRIYCLPNTDLSFLSILQRN